MATNNVDSLLDGLSKHSDNVIDNFQAELTGKDKANFHNTEYTEEVVSQGKGDTLDSIADGIAGIPLGNILKHSELKAGDRITNKLVLFNGYTTNQNRFNEFNQDVVYRFTDREGYQFTSHEFNGLDTSNMESKQEALKEMEGKAIWFSADVTRGKGENQLYVDPRQLMLCKELMDQEGLVNDFFKGKIEGVTEYANSFVSQLVDGLNLSVSLWNKYMNNLMVKNIPRISSQSGSLMIYLDKLLKMVNTLDLPRDDVDIILASEIVLNLKTRFTSQDIIELTTIIGQETREEVRETVLEEALLDTYSQDREVTFHKELVEGIKQTIYTAILVDTYRKYGYTELYNDLTKRNNIITRGR